MSDATIGEIRLFTYPTLIPNGWLPCEGQILEITKYTALYSLLSIRFGGDAKTTFALPDLRGRTPVHWGNAPSGRIGSSLNIGDKGGSETATLSQAQIPAHNHTFMVEPTNAAGATVANSLPSTSTKPSAAAPTAPAAPNLYAAPGTTTVPLNPAFIGVAGAGAGHENRQPFLAMRFCICVEGLYPQRN
jgi:microcystin-dependent protein